jgi:hypothetical protein
MIFFLLGAERIGLGRKCDVSRKFIKNKRSQFGYCDLSKKLQNKQTNKQKQRNKETNNQQLFQTQGETQAVRYDQQQAPKGLSFLLNIERSCVP